MIRFAIDVQSNEAELLIRILNGDRTDSVLIKAKKKSCGEIVVDDRRLIKFFKDEHTRKYELAAQDILRIMIDILGWEE